MATAGDAGEEQEVRPARLHWELLAELLRDSHKTLRSSSVGSKDLVLTSCRALMMLALWGPWAPPSPRRTWKGCRGHRRLQTSRFLVSTSVQTEIIGDVQVLLQLETGRATKDLNYSVLKVM